MDPSSGPFVFERGTDHIIEKLLITSPQSTQGLPRNKGLVHGGDLVTQAMLVADLKVTPSPNLSSTSLDLSSSSSSSSTSSSETPGSPGLEQDDDVISITAPEEGLDDDIIMVADTLSEPSTHKISPLVAEDAPPLNPPLPDPAVVTVDAPDTSPTMEPAPKRPRVEQQPSDGPKVVDLSELIGTLTSTIKALQPQAAPDALIELNQTLKQYLPDTNRYLREIRDLLREQKLNAKVAAVAPPSLDPSRHNREFSAEWNRHQERYQLLPKSYYRPCNDASRDPRKQ